jgi:hypothetical protein
MIASEFTSVYCLYCVCLYESKTKLMNIHLIKQSIGGNYFLSSFIAGRDCASGPESGICNVIFACDRISWSSVYRALPQSLQANARTLPQNRVTTACFHILYKSSFDAT